MGSGLAFPRHIPRVIIEDAVGMYHFDHDSRRSTYATNAPARARAQRCSAVPRVPRLGNVASGSRSPNS